MRYFMIVVLSIAFLGCNKVATRPDFGDDVTTRVYGSTAATDDDEQGRDHDSIPDDQSDDRTYSDPTEDVAADSDESSTDSDEDGRSCRSVDYRVEYRDDRAALKFESVGKGLGEEGERAVDLFVFELSENQDTIEVTLKASNDSETVSLPVVAGATAKTELGFRVTLDLVHNDGLRLVFAIASIDNRHGLSHLVFVISSGEIIENTRHYVSCRSDLDDISDDENPDDNDDQSDDQEQEDPSSDDENDPETSEDQSNELPPCKKSGNNGQYDCCFESTSYKISFSYQVGPDDGTIGDKLDFTFITNNPLLCGERNIPTTMSLSSYAFERRTLSELVVTIENALVINDTTKVCDLVMLLEDLADRSSIQLSSDGGE